MEGQEEEFEYKWECSICNLGEESCKCECSKCGNCKSEPIFLDDKTCIEEGRYIRKSENIVICSTCVICSKCKKNDRKTNVDWTWYKGGDFVCGLCVNK